MSVARQLPRMKAHDVAQDVRIIHNQNCEIVCLKCQRLLGPKFREVKTSFVSEIP